MLVLPDPNRYSKEVLVRILRDLQQILYNPDGDGNLVSERDWSAESLRGEDVLYDFESIMNLLAPEKA